MLTFGLKGWQVMFRKQALVIGINDYDSSPLQYCRADAEEIATILSMVEYDYHVTTLFDETATQRNLKQHITKLLTSKSESFLLYFAGHGWATDTGTYLVSIDGDAIEPGLDLDWLRRAINNFTDDKQQVIVILDCCHSGASKLRTLGQSGITIRPEDIRTAVPDLHFGKVLLAACGSSEVAQEHARLGHGLYTSALLEAMLGGAADDNGEVTVARLHDYVCSKIVQPGSQVPVFRGDFAGRIILGRGLAPTSTQTENGVNLSEIEAQAELHLNNYQTHFAANYGSAERWRNDGYRSCCQLLEPIMAWFNKRRRELLSTPYAERFEEIYASAVRHLEPLCTLSLKTNTPMGIVENKLGSGQFGSVWHIKARNPGGQDFAFKLFHPHDLQDIEKVTRFRRGYEAMNQLDHPHIVKVHRLTEAPLGFYMDYIDGANLRDFIGTVEEPAALLSILLACAETIEHAHARRVVHRDIKPENIIMAYHRETEQWIPHLSDFDLAWYSTATQVTQYDGFGTLQYAAPEQLRNPKSPSAHAPSADVYAFGQLCFFMVTGSDPTPFDETGNEKVLLNRIGNGWVSEAATIFVDLYRKCVFRDPKQRPSFDTISKDLFTVFELLRDIDYSTDLDVDRFVSELVFSIVGLSPEHRRDSGQFISMSGKTFVTVVVENQRRSSCDIRFEFSCTSAPMISGVSSFEKMRSIMIKKISDFTISLGSGSVKPGSQGPFEVLVRQEGVVMTLEGLKKVRELVVGVCKVLEAG